jgi:hypothetical protein
MLLSFPNIRTVPHFETICLLSLYHDFTLHSEGIYSVYINIYKTYLHKHNLPQCVSLLFLITTGESAWEEILQLCQQIFAIKGKEKLVVIKFILRCSEFLCSLNVMLYCYVHFKNILNNLYIFNFF